MSYEDIILKHLEERLNEMYKDVYEFENAIVRKYEVQIKNDDYCAGKIILIKTKNPSPKN